MDLTDLEPCRDDDAGIIYTPWSDGRAVGFKATHAGGEVEYIYLNPSDGSDDGVPNVFVYIGPTGDPSQDNAIVHFEMMEGGDPQTDGEVFGADAAGNPLAWPAPSGGWVDAWNGWYPDREAAAAEAEHWTADVAHRRLPYGSDLVSLDS